MVLNHVFGVTLQLALHWVLQFLFLTEQWLLFIFSGTGFADRGHEKKKEGDCTLYLCVIKPLSQMYTPKTIASVEFLLSR